MILFRGDARGYLDPYFLAVRPDGTLVFHIEDEQRNIAELTTSVPVGRFLHLAATLDDSTGQMRLYIDGLLVAEQITEFRPFGELDPSSGPKVAIGNYIDDSISALHMPFSGIIDELRVYGRALSADEIQAIYTAGAAGVCKETFVPTIVTPPSNQAVGVGSNAEFKVVATFAEPLSYQWQLNGVDIPGQTTALLSLSNLQSDQAGSYTVVVKTPKGVTASASAKLTFTFVELQIFAGLSIRGEVGQVYRIEYQDSLTQPPTWQPLKTLTLQSTSEVFIDYDSPGVAKRFYRAVLVGM